MKHTILAFLLGVVVSLGAGYLLTDSAAQPVPTAHTDEHSDGVHVHSDIVVWLDGQELDLTADRYMSASDQVLHDDIHFHDNRDDVLHRHGEGITLGEFFGSLGLTLENDCFTLNDEEETTYCSGEGGNELILYVNGEPVADPADYVNQEEDQLLLFYGDPATTDLSALFDRITNDSCIFSYTCPERGTPPPESCGLTCEL